MSRSPPSPPPLAGAEPRPRPGSRNGWSILHRFPVVVGAENLVLGADFAAGLDAPPSPSYLTISRGALPAHENPRSYAFLHSVDAGGRYLVVSTIQGSGAERVLVCHAGSGKASALPEVPVDFEVKLSARECIGVIDDPRGDAAYLVAQLRPAPASAASSAPEAGGETAARSVAAPSMSKVTPASEAGKEAAPSVSKRTPAAEAGKEAAPSVSKRRPASEAACNDTAPAPTSERSEPDAAAPPVPASEAEAGDMTASASMVAVSTTRGPELGVLTAPVVVVDTPASPSMAGVPTAPSLSTLAPLAPFSSGQPFKLCFNSCDDTWSVNDVTIRSPKDDLSKFHVDTVVCYDSNLCFVDLSTGLIMLDPLLYGYDAKLVMFPVAEGADYSPSARSATIGLRRATAVSEGRLLFLLMEGEGQEAMLRMWSLDVAHSWIPDVAIAVSEVLNHSTYCLAGLPPRVLPSLGVLSPHNAGILYMISGKFVFSVQLDTRQTIDCSMFFADVGIGSPVHSSMDICAWVLPSPPTPRPGNSAGRTTWQMMKARGKHWGRSAWKLVVDNRGLMETLPLAANIAGCLVPSQFLDATRAAGLVATRVCEGLQIAEIWSTRFPSKNGGIDLITVGTQDEASRAIKHWEDEGQPDDMYIQYAPFMTAEEMSDLREFVTARGAESLLKYIDCWIGDYEVLGRSSET